MLALTNTTQIRRSAEAMASSPADPMLSVVSSLLGNIGGWSILFTTLLAIVIYDQGIAVVDEC
jgi:hypothetical protein